MRIGQGYDVHALVTGRKLILGGVDVPHRLGLLGHSDADVVLHAACDAVLGALGKGDIGQHFPDSEQQYKGVNSRLLLRNVAQLMKEDRYQIGNLDLTIVAQAPKLASYLELMRKRISSDLECSEWRVNLKATTTEGLGFVGREEGIECHAVVVLTETENFKPS